ncbi:hypothetical protein ACN47E_009540 [Coniothyrium glycines]
MSKRYTFEDEQSFRELTYKWSIAWDTKDLSTFLSITAPEITVDYRDFPAVKILRRCAPGDFFKSSFNADNLGHPDLHIQHLLGAAMFERVSDDEATGSWQVRARHVRQKDNGEVADWDSSNITEFRYTRVNGEWKLSGLRPHTVVAAIGKPEDVIGKF